MATKRKSKAAGGSRGGARSAGRKPAGDDAERQLGEYRRKRDFSRTAEPAGGKTSAGRTLAFVIQKHAATRLHFDLRLEMDGVMKSWAVPKGPSVDPSVKRLAMQVEDHPIEYNTFEGTIPKGQYGGGTVMLWDRGTYGPAGDDPDDFGALRAGYHKGDFKFLLHGERLQGSWVLVRTRFGDSDKPQWLLIKHRDEHAREGEDIVAEVTTSVATGRTLEEIAEGDSDVWNSDRDDGGEERKRGGAATRKSSARKSSARTSPPKKSPAGKSAAKRPTPKRSTAKKTSARKSAARKSATKKPAKRKSPASRKSSATKSRAKSRPKQS